MGGGRDVASFHTDHLPENRTAMSTMLAAEIVPVTAPDERYAASGRPVYVHLKGFASVALK